MEREPTAFGRAPRIGENSVWIVALGIVRVLAGVLAMSLPFWTGLATAAVVGAVLIVVGVVHVFQAFRADSWGAGILGFLEGALAVVAGILMFAFPVNAVATLSTVAMWWLFFDGVVRIAFAFKVRPLEGWGWALASGVISLALGAWLLTLLPLSAAVTIGVFVGASMIASGWWTVAVGAAAMRFHQRRQARV